MIFKEKIIVRYAETDQMGIVHHSVYPIWYEVARTGLSKELGITYSKMEEKGALMPVLELQCKYMKPLKYDDEMEVCVQVQKISPVRITFYYEIYKTGELTPVNTGTTMHAFVNPNMRPINLKKLHPEVYRALEESIEIK